MEWISVNDRLPKDRETVLVYSKIKGFPFEDNTFVIRRGYYNKWAESNTWYAINNGDYRDGGYGNDYKANVTHWMPLPEPPKD